MRLLFDTLSASNQLQRCTALLVGLFLLFSGCGGSKDYEEYAAPQDANAQLVVLPQVGDTFDVFLDGKHLGRISWTQPYAISAGQHVFYAKLAGGLTKRGTGAEYAFAIAPGETLHLAIARLDGDGQPALAGTEEVTGGDIRISVINP